VTKYDLLGYLNNRRDVEILKLETRHMKKRDKGTGLARMCVPKMVKNGFGSVLPVSPVFEEDKIPREMKNRHGAQSRL
jgi:hypothetical protein